MGIVDNALIGASGQGGYFLTRSLRLRNSASAYLSRTPASTTNRTTATYSGWIKRGALNSTQQIFQQGDNNANTNFIEFGNDAGGAGDFLCLTDYNAGGYKIHLVSVAVYRDPSAWYHIVVAYDTTQATAANRVKVWVNNVQVTAWTVADYPAQNATLVLNTTVPMSIGRWYTTSRYYDGYMTEVNFIDGQALTPSSFGSTNTLTGVWQPAKYTGTYGTNGFYLPFTDNSALTTSSNIGLGKDFSGNGNYWTTNNISITAGTTYDSMTDVPTLTSATASNFCVGNPLSVGANTSLSNGNLSGTLTGSGGWAGTICGLTSGKWYYEATPTANSGNSMWVGFLSDVYTKNDNAWSYSTQTALYANDGRNGNNASYGATWTTNDVIGIAIDLSTSSGSVTFYKNGVSQGVMFSSLTSSAVWRPLISGGGTGTTIAMNFGQRPFAYTPPTGFVALNTYNLPTGTILKGNTVMDATLYSGNSSATQTIVNAAGFQPDAVWLKSRSTVDGWAQVDSVRGVNKLLQSNNTNAESTTGSVTAFNSNGFTADVNFNVSGRTYIGYQWQAGQGTTSTNTAGTISATVSVNASAGFSIVVYTGNGTNGATVGHGLGVKPSLIIEKGRSTTYSWSVQGCGVLWPTATQTLFLNGTNALNPGSGVAAPTSSVFTPSATLYANESGVSNVAYLFAPIAGYSAFGNYTGNGSTDGPFIYTGFRPKFVLVKRTDVASSWIIWDSVRGPYNANNNDLYPDLNIAEYASPTDIIDILSNGFKLRATGGGSNGSGNTFIYAAFAESPFKNSLAR